MELAEALSGNQSWWSLLGMLLYAVPLGVLRAVARGAAPPHVRAVDGLSMLALGGALPWAGRHLTVAQAVAGVGTVVAVLLAFRCYLTRAAARRCPPRAVPLLLLFRGRFLPGALHAAHLSETALRRELVRQGVRRVRRLFVLIQEPNGELSWSYFPTAPTVLALLSTAVRLNPN
ncbi:hypothetical protein MON38_19890 [Hymenobacter sp. DH14]|uniref:Uncharacterized protein n=1 Tax=Hymenobacter cyanobacteriorum TaxID=2926463 RepID=A0A9X1VJ92_9BACT|nr:hypothetical protein [Hymenobacter cyanobacteriorum]MCI1189690.1 hypothetical protein [Hymenobacter cyanobacteriorum]